MATRPFLLAGLLALSAAMVRPAMADVIYVTYTGTAAGVDDAVTVTDGPPATSVPEPASGAVLAGVAGVFAAACFIRRARSRDHARVASSPAAA